MRWCSLSPVRATAAMLLLAALSGLAQAQPRNPAADAAYEAAARFQKIESDAAAAEAWEKFLKGFPTDPRIDQAYYSLGTCFLRQKKFDQALAAFQTVVQKHPDSAVLEASYLSLGITQYRLGQTGRAGMYEAAADTLNILLARFPRGRWQADAAFYRAECLYLRDRKREAAQAYAQFLVRYPTHRFVADALYALGVSQADLGDADAAGRTFDEFLARFPENRLADEVGMRRGLTLVAKGSYAEAIPWLAKAAARPGFPLADYALLRQADALMQAKQYTEAAALFASLPTRFAASSYAERARILAGKCHYLAGQYDAARKVLDPLVAAGGPAAPEAAHWMALGLVKQGQAEQAAALADRVLARAAPGPAAAQLAVDAADALLENPARRKDAVARYAAAAARYPRDPIAPQSLYMAGYVALEQRDYPTAWKYAADFLAAYPKHEIAVDVLRVAAESGLQLGKYAEAEKLYAQLVRGYPKHGDVDLWRIRRLVALHRQKKHQETIAAGEQDLGELRSPEARAEAFYLLGFSQTELNRHAAAVKSLAASVAAQPRWRQADETWLLLAQGYRQLNDLSSARASLTRMIEQLPGSRFLDRAHARLGECCYAAGDYRAAAEAYRLLIGRWPQSPLVPQALHELGCAQLGLQDAQAAEKTLTTLVEKYPKHSLAPRARYARALAREQLKKFAAAVEDLQAVLSAASKGGERSDARYLLGLCQMGLKQYAAAAAAFQALLQEDPKYTAADNAEYQLSWAWKLGGKEAEAAKAFAKFAADFPKSPLAAEAHEHVGDFAYHKKDYATAAAAYYAASEKAAGTARGEKAAYRLGWAYYQQADYDRAEQTFRYQIRVYPQGPLAQDAAFMAAESLLKQGKFAEAISAYAQVEKPSSQESRVLSLMHAAQAAAELKEWQKGLDLLARAKKQFPDSPLLPDILYEQGRAQQGLGSADQAMAAYQAVIGRSEGEAAARSQLAIGQLQLDAKQHDKAAESFLKVAYGYSFPSLQAEAAFHAARCYETLGKKAEALDLYGELIKRFPESERVSPAKNRVEQLKKPAR